MGGLFAGTSLERPVTCERCGQPLGDCRCPRDSSGRIVLPKDQPLRVRRETGGRGGKVVTVVVGLDPVATDAAALLRDLKAALGAGGAVKHDKDATRLELQGDHRDRVVEALKARGYPAKAAGG